MPEGTEHPLSTAGSSRARRTAFAHAVLLESRRSPAWLLVPAVVGLGLFAAFAELTPGVSYWGNAMAASQASTIASGPVVSGVAALVASRDHRMGLGWLDEVAVRGPGFRHGARLLATLLWAWLGQGLVLAAVSTRILVGNTWGELEPLALLISPLGLSAYALFGYLVGVLLPHVLTVPVVALAAFSLHAVGFALSPTAEALLPARQQLVNVWTAVPATLHLRLVVWFLGLVLALLAVLVLVCRLRDRHRRRRPWRLAVLGAAAVVASLTAIPVLALGGRTTLPAEPPFTPVCTWHGELELCLHPAFDHASADLGARLAVFHEMAGDSPLAFDRVEHRPRGMGEAPVGEGVAVHLDDTAEGTLVAAVQELAFNLSGLDECFRPFDERVEQGVEDPDAAAGYNTLVSTAIAQPGVPVADAGGVYREAADFLAGLSVPEWREWLSRHGAAYQGCALTEEAFSR
ncbi:hypothetical protein C1701_15700 [Actinoalloteichus sp. AHMU CJ021]|uniref:ABC transporter permease n=1 Tax=Actinoalloteichus caeruleus DSM 43889 TaxID=1120930 RepID=A0ABT1JP32_ACTCY|nr:hypothetical protein [Actinoalloteichus caeruleus]AUS79546.1 hypothetical protein C1701_15700 [Actinoalloteichus sp. AHMU CJ021]MCP2333929.1 hypothetical protein [Actinoalloteichus caeruleus DSM 43889]